LPSIFPYETLRRNNGYKQGFKEGFMIRITAGEWKGREIKTPPQAKAAQGLRPTLAKTRQALFNSIQFQIPDARILDLFSGSGALGLEALSRGAAHVTFVESDGDSLRCLRENTQAFKAGDRVTILAGRVEKVLRAFGETANPSDAPTPPPDLYDLIFADPPYHAGWETRIFEEIPLHRLLKPGGLFVFVFNRIRLLHFSDFIAPIETCLFVLPNSHLIVRAAHQGPRVRGAFDFFPRRSAIRLQRSLSGISHDSLTILNSS
jgi:16S rRNA (guanine966-N2)-methyltransferase